MRNVSPLAFVVREGNNYLFETSRLILPIAFGFNYKKNQLQNVFYCFVSLSID